MSLTLVFAAAAAIQPKIVDKRDSYDDARAAFVVFETHKTYLGVGCFNVADRSTVAVVAKFERFVGRERQGIFAGGTLVQYRFDQRQAQIEHWNSQRYNVREGGASAMRFLLAMKGSRQIHLRARREDGDIVEITFSYSDPSRLIDDVLGRCGFNPDGSRSASPRR
jgi:hypothetical protein